MEGKGMALESGKIIFEDWEKAKARRARQMPTEHDCLRVMMEAYLRLNDLGWLDAIYCPKDGSVFDSVEFGSTGIHSCHYEGEWPDGSWLVHDGGDLWPSRPSLYRERKDRR